MVKRSLGGAVLPILLGTVLLSGCGDDAPGSLFGETTTIGPTSTTPADSTTTLLATTTTTAPTTTTTLDPLLLDIFSVEPTAPAGTPVGVDAVLGGPPDRAVSAVLTAAATDVGVDLTGVTIEVWPVDGDAGSLLVLTFDEAAVAYSGDDTDGELLLVTLTDHPIVDDQGITRLVVRLRATDEEGPYLFTYTVTFDTMRAAQASGESIPADQVAVSLERLTP